MSFEEQAVLLPHWVQVWMNVLVAVPVISVIVLLFNSATRRDALVVFVLTALAFGSTLFLHSQMGMVRLLGLGHVLFWTPLAIYLFSRTKRDFLPLPGRVVMGILLVTIAAALVFDYYDVLRWLMGEQESIV